MTLPVTAIVCPVGAVLAQAESVSAERPRKSVRTIFRLLRNHRHSKGLGPIDIQKMASRKWWFSVTRSAACFLHVRTGSSESRHLQTARAECRLVLERAARRWKTDKGRLHLRYRSNRSTRRRIALAAMTLDRKSTRLNSSH